MLSDFVEFLQSSHILYIILRRVIDGEYNNVHMA